MPTALEICRRNATQSRKTGDDVRARFPWVKPIADSLREAFGDPDIIDGIALYEDNALVLKWGTRRHDVIGGARAAGVAATPSWNYKPKE